MFSLTAPPPPPSFSSLPDEIVLSFLARISKSYYSSLCLVSKSFYSLLSSPEIYSARSEIGAREPRLYLCLRLPKSPDHHHSWFFLGEIEGELSSVPVRLSSSHSLERLNSTTVAVGPEIYQIGGSNDNKLYSSAVDVFDCRSHM
ncbi:unnamed protein product [Microthlaspi erraticum]|uniref:F-box domain-containing protein n=1 Tax=Microthlaspi erraticum TaxID=1685480 RepID=A0A6D2HUE0_9BRAS|nr:unnamed protein product [Microthlaspi erraticum]